MYLDIDDPANDSMKQALGYRYQPHLFLVNEQGQVLGQWLGPVTREDLATAFETELAP